MAWNALIDPLTKQFYPDLIPGGGGGGQVNSLTGGAGIDIAGTAVIPQVNLAFTATAGELMVGTGTLAGAPLPPLLNGILSCVGGTPTYIAPGAAGEVLSIGQNGVPGYAAVGQAPYTAVGQMQYGGAAPLFPDTPLNIGTQGQILKVNGGVPAWIDAGGSGTITATFPLVESAVGAASNIAIDFSAKGDIPVGLGAGVGKFLPLGTDGQVLVADPANTSTGMRWATNAPIGGPIIVRTSGGTVPIDPPTTQDSTLVLVADKILNEFWKEWVPPLPATLENYTLTAQYAANAGVRYIAITEIGTKGAWAGKQSAILYRVDVQPPVPCLACWWADSVGPNVASIGGGQDLTGGGAYFIVYGSWNYCQNYDESGAIYNYSCMMIMDSTTSKIALNNTTFSMEVPVNDGGWDGVAKSDPNDAGVDDSSCIINTCTFSQHTQSFIIGGNFTYFYKAAVPIPYYRPYCMASFTFGVPTAQPGNQSSVLWSSPALATSLKLGAQFSTTPSESVVNIVLDSYIPGGIFLWVGGKFDTLGFITTSAVITSRFIGGYAFPTTSTSTLITTSVPFALAGEVNSMYYSEVNAGLLLITGNMLDFSVYATQADPIVISTSGLVGLGEGGLNCALSFSSFLDNPPAITTAPADLICTYDPGNPSTSPLVYKSTTNGVWSLVALIADAGHLGGPPYFQGVNNFGIQANRINSTPATQLVGATNIAGYYLAQTSTVQSQFIATPPCAFVADYTTHPDGQQTASFTAGFSQSFVSDRDIQKWILTGGQSSGLTLS